jgi:hypothetical protein
MVCGNLKGRLSAFSFLTGGGLFAAFLFFHPANDASGAREPLWLGALVFSQNAVFGNALTAAGRALSQALPDGLGSMRLGWALRKEKRVAAAA